MNEHCDSDKPQPETKFRFAAIVNLGYYPEANGRSYYRVQCECGQINEIFCWRGIKKCERCGMVMSVKYSPEGKLIVGELRKPKKQPIVIVKAPCTTCGKELVYLHGVGWKHSPVSSEDYRGHPALPVPDKIVRKEDRGADI